MNGLRELLVDDMPADQQWALDRGLLYGDGLFETMLVRNGLIRFDDLHRGRLAEGCRRLAIAADIARIWASVQRHARRQGNALLRLHVTRGIALARGYTPAGAERPRYVLAVFDAGEAAPPDPLRVCRIANRLGENPELAGLKHCNRLEQVLARLTLAKTGAFEGLQASSSGLLVSGTMSNVFLVLDGELVTPAMDRCGVAGVARAAVLREAGRMDMPVRVGPVDFDAVVRATAMALSNARMGLACVDEFEGHALARDPRLAALAARVAAS